MSATSGNGKRGALNSQRDASLGSALEAAPVAGLVDSSPLTYGFTWPICSVKPCSKLLGLQIGKVEDDGKLSHSLCDEHFALEMLEARGGDDL